MAAEAFHWAAPNQPSTRRWRILISVVLSAVFALAATTQAIATKPDPEHKVTLCHATSSESNPFVEITIDEAALDAHLSNHGDVYPVPEGGCEVEPDPTISDA